MSSASNSARPQANRSTSQTGTRRERFLKSLGIPSFQHSIERKEPIINPNDHFAHGGGPVAEPRATPSSSTPLNLDNAAKADVDKSIQPPAIGERSSKLLSPSDADKRASSIRLRNYKSIGNLDVKAREDLAQDEEDFYEELFNGGMAGTKSMPLGLNRTLEHKEIEGNLTKIHVSARNPSSSDIPGKPERTEVAVHMRASGVDQEYVKVYQDFATLHDALVEWGRTNGHLRDLYIPDLPTCIKPIVPLERNGSSLSQFSDGSPQSTVSRPTISSSKKRQGSFLSNLQNKVKNTIRAVSDSTSSRSGTTSPVHQPASPPFLAAAPLSPALTPSNSLEQTNSSLGLGKFDFENKSMSPMIEQFTAPENTAQKPPDSPISETTEELAGMSLDSAAALVTAMTISEGFARTASRPFSVAIKAGGLYSKQPTGSHLLPSPSFAPLESSLDQPPSTLDGREQPAMDQGEAQSLSDAKELSTYLNLLAQQLAVRSSLPWINFFASTAIPSASPTGKIAWDPSIDQQVDLEREQRALIRMSSSQRKKMVRKSRSLGEGLIALFSAGQGETDTLQPVEAPIQTLSENETVKVTGTEQYKSLIHPEIPDTMTLDQRALNDLEPEARDKGAEASAESEPICRDTASPDEGDDARAKGAVDAPIIAGPEPREQSPTSSQPVREDVVAGGTKDTVDPVLKVEKRKRPGIKAASVEDFELIRVLGKGCAGKVVLVKYKKTGGLFAMKAIVKQHVLAHNELAHTLTEQSVLKRMSSAELSNPFIVKLWWSFHDEDNLYLVLDFLPGGDLATQLSRWGRLGRDRARFYTCEIVEGVEALHAAGIIYRDLKPENILLGADGHISLADFGLAAEFANSKGPLAAAPGWMEGSTGSQHLGSAGSFLVARDSASSFVGTAEYLAPEVIKGLPYSYEVDWWALGTMLYEALIGNTPFWVDNHAEMYMRVVNEELRFPEDRVLDKETKSFIRGLLQKDPVFRLCEPRIRKHPYLAMVDWDHVKHKRYIPPYIPPTDKNLEYDVQNFDDSFLAMDLALKADVASVSGDSETEESDKEIVIPAEDAFDGYQYRHQDIISVFEPEISVIDEHIVEDEAQPGTAETVVTSSSSSPSQSDASVEDPIPDTTVTSTPTVEAATAMLQRIQALTTEAAEQRVKTSRHSREIMRGSVDRISRSENDEDDWDIIEDDPEAVATNGRDTLFARGVVDKYRLAVLKRRESTVRRKPSIKFKRSSPSSSTILGRAGDEIPPLPATPRPSGLKHRLRNRMRTPKSLSPSPAQTLVPSLPAKCNDQVTLSAPRQLAVRNDSSQSVNSTGWSTENGSDGATSLDSRLTARALDTVEDRRRGSAGV